MMKTSVFESSNMTSGTFADFALEFLTPFYKVHSFYSIPESRFFLKKMKLL